MEHRGVRADQAHPGRSTDPPLERQVRAGRPPASRPGQMVSGRAAAALGVLAVLAHRRQADLAERGADRARKAESAGRTVSTDDAHPLHRGPCRPARHHHRARAAGLRGPRRADAQGGRAAAQHRPGRSQDRRSGRARPHHARIRAASLRADRLRAAGAALGRAGGRRLDQRDLATAPPQAVPGAGRFAGRLPAAAQLAALYQADRRAASGAGRHLRGARRVARSGRDGARIRRQRPRQIAAGVEPAPTPRRREARPPSPNPFRCAPRSRSSRATAGFACSCRRSRSSRTISSFSPPSRRPPPSSTCRSTSKAICRRPIRG